GSTEEESTREQYDATIAEPLRAVFRQRHWWTVNESPGKSPVVTAGSIHFVAIIKGVPLKIHSADSYSGDQPGNGPIRSRNEASVDSELSAIGFYSREISGAIPNSYFRSFRAIGDFPRRLSPNRLRSLLRLVRGQGERTIYAPGFSFRARSNRGPHLFV